MYTYYENILYFLLKTLQPKFLIPHVSNFIYSILFSNLINIVHLYRLFRNTINKASNYYIYKHILILEKGLVSLL